MSVLIQFVYLIILALANNFLLKRFPDQSIAVTLAIFAVSVLCGIITIKNFREQEEQRTYDLRGDFHFS